MWFVTEVIGTTHMLTSSQRSRVFDALFNQVKITTGHAPTVIEAPCSGDDFYDRRGNDDGDPFSINWAGNSTQGDEFKRKIADLVPAEATANILPGVEINIRWASPWLKTLRGSDYNRFLDECAEQVLAGVTYWKNTHGREPRHALIFNEPTIGNGDLDGGPEQQMVDIIKRAGSRLRAAGFNTVKFAAPSQETELTSLNAARLILADPDARQYIGALSYHAYPYGSMYSYIPNILRTAGAGRSDARMISLRNQLRDLGKQYGIPLWMNEVSHGLDGIASPDLQSFDVVRGRAIHIHDELTYADAAAFHGMQSLFSSETRRLHNGTPVLTDPDDIVATYQETDRVAIAGGYTIGHYARCVNRGAVRIQGESSDPLILVSAFQDPVQKRVVLVVINNDTLTGL